MVPSRTVRARAWPPGVRQYWPLAALAVGGFLLYLPALSRGFTSEDFLLLRYLLSGETASKLAAQFHGPWLGIPIVKFYRPVSTLFFALEGLVYGPRSWMFNLTHVLLHLANAGLVYDLIRRLWPSDGIARTTAITAGFICYPLHPNAVLFAASFATLIGALLSLASLLIWAAVPPGRRLLRGGLAVAVFALALGSYELAAVLPVAVVLVDLLREPRQGLSVRSRLTGWAPWFFVLAAYLLFRARLFGEVVGGYGDLGAVLTSWNPLARLRDAARALPVLLWPAADGIPGESLRATSTYGLIALAVGWAVVRARSGSTRSLRGLAFGLAWILLWQAPFAWTIISPASGRFWYVASIGGACLFVEACEVLTPKRVGYVAPWIAATLLAVLWLRPFLGMRSTYQSAGEVARAGSAALAAEISAAPGVPFFCSGYPLFLNTRSGAPAAQVFHYGLADSVRPPFGESRALVYPLTPGVVSEIDALVARRGPDRFLRWRPETAGWDRIAPAGGTAAGILAVDGPEEDVAWSPAASRLSFSGRRGITYSVVIAAEGNAHRTLAEASPDASGLVHARLATDFMATMVRLYGSPVYWWVEGRDGDGRLVEFSVARRLRLPSG